MCWHYIALHHYVKMQHIYVWYLVLQGVLYDGMDVLDHLMSQSNVMPRLNSRILSAGEHFLDFTTLVPASAMKSPTSYAELSTADMTAAMLSNMDYAAKKGMASLKKSCWCETS